MSLTIDQLRWFCADVNDEREWLRQPFKRGEFVYATNGHIAIRVAADGLDAPDLAPDKLPGMDGVFAAVEPERFIAMPKIKMAQKCSACDGARAVRMAKCGDCDDGTFLHGEHEYECKNCDVAGWVGSDAGELRPCIGCDGLGRMRENASIVGNNFELVYLGWIARLPGPVKFAVGTSQEAVAAFIFNGGEGRLMPKTMSRHTQA